MNIDIAIVGGGPAGAWAAYSLARGGARVAILDGSHPREKPCGGGVTGRARALISHALPSLAAPAVVVHTVRFENEDMRAVDVPLAATEAESALLVTSRRTFDSALLAAAVDAGAALIPERVVDVTVGPGRAEIRTTRGTYRAAGLIGADGANSLVRRRLFAPFTRSQLSVGTGYFAPGVRSRELIIRFSSDPPGYLWVFPRPDHLAIGICAQADEARAAPLRERTAAWIQRCGVAPGARLEPYGWPIPTLTARDLDRERPAAPRWMLVGDAAGLVDPITREGIFFALQSAGYAAEALASGGGERYTERLRDEIYPELRRAAQLKSGFFWPPFVRLLMEALAQSAAIREVMADLVAGRQPYRNLKRRLLGTFEGGLAWRLLRTRPPTAGPGGKILTKERIYGQHRPPGNGADCGDPRSDLRCEPAARAWPRDRQRHSELQGGDPRGSRRGEDQRRAQ